MDFIFAILILLQIANLFILIRLRIKLVKQRNFFIDTAQQMVDINKAYAGLLDEIIESNTPNTSRMSQNHSVADQ